ncbi:type VI secretion system-associated FHA domain protein TagH [Sulfitobacter sp. G21635-S1]|nr:type VI secretion system-associated FHA domain protein TagH [Sulfitobacter sp. G21635-S1]MCZ4255602.1 type VI secretion system-associated FHA domain protein TagH [Sulfitobacter sp. G21635-S1]
MTLRLVLENAPHAQAEREKIYNGGKLMIGRGDDADWQLVDPDMFVSRQHAILTEEDGRIMVTDASSGGLFIDNAANPLGAGNSAPLEPGMRLHLGNFVLRVEAVTTRDKIPAEPTKRSGAGVFSFEFGADETPEEPVRERPAELPDVFGVRSDNRVTERSREPVREPPPLDRRDPFELDLRGARDDAPKQSDKADASNAQPRKSGSYFDVDPPRDKTPEADSWMPELDSVKPAMERSDPAQELPARDPVARDEAAAPEAPRPPTAAVGQAPEPGKRTVAPGADDSALRAAFFRGMGLDPSRLPPGDAEEEMERIGHCLRGLVEGVMLLLRTRAQEKQRVRVAQTVIASANVNPLKFLATTDDGLVSLLQPRGEGYLSPEDAVAWAFRDLTDHQVRTWTALQTALRRMIDSFDPAEIEKEMEDTGLLETLIAGGRSAKLWQLYKERYKEIAEAAEERFLGEVGADFRDAYENEGRS